MAAPDPASEALIRKLHRELNGFTRRSRNPPQPEHHPGPRKLLQDRRGADSVTPSEDPSDKGLNSRPTSEEERSAEHGKTKAKRERQDAPERPAKLARRSSPAPVGPGPVEEKSRNAGNKVAVAAAAAVHVAPQVPLTPLEEAAALASAMTRVKTKQASRFQAQAADAKVIKCFHAGIRWGITLTADAIKRRSDLATALNDAYAGQILSCGRGDMLHVLFLDQAGHTYEFPALRSDVKESASHWKACVDKAVRVYVMR